MSANLNNLVNHVALVLDASGSMSSLRRDVIRVADQQIKYLARRSQELNQETRVSVYVFGSRVNCIIWDMDVLRLPSIADHYKDGGMTALIDAALLSQRDLSEIPERHGDHSFLTFILTDGQENDSRQYGVRDLVDHLGRMKDHWTLAVLVPDQIGKREAMQYGFPKDNIAIWDATSTQGVEEVGEVIRAATDTFMTGRSRGIRGSRAVFSTGADAVNAQTVKAADLKPVDPSEYLLLRTTEEGRIDEFVKGSGYRYVTGTAYYELVKTETIQPQKNVLVMDKKSGHVYTGSDARSLVGLPDMTVRAKPSFNPDYKILVQSTSVNRKLLAGNQVLVMNPRAL